MTSPKGMDELFWGKEFEDVHDWVDRLEMATKVREIDEQKLFKIGMLNLGGKSKDWYKKLATIPTNWPAMKLPCY
jgi:hypothetical protein